MPTNMGPLKAGISRWARQVHDGALDDMPDRMRPYAPLGKVVPRGRTPGTLRKSIRHAPGGGQYGTRIRGRIEAPVIQAETTERGSPAHIIRPRRVGGLLVFYWPKVGKIVGFRFVHHPGNQPKPWWKRALQATYGPALRYRSLTTPFR